MSKISLGNVTRPHFKTKQSWAWWYIPIIPTIRRLRQEGPEFKGNLGYDSEFEANLSKIETK
jgi:hypothetical protein